MGAIKSPDVSAGKYLPLPIKKLFVRQVAIYFRQEEKYVELANLDNEFHKMFGHTIPLIRMGLGRVEELVKLLHSWIRIVNGKEGTMVVAIDRGFIRTVASNVRKLLLEEVDQMELKMFVDKMASR